MRVVNCTSQKPGSYMNRVVRDCHSKISMRKRAHFRLFAAYPAFLRKSSANKCIATLRGKETHQIRPVHRLQSLAHPRYNIESRDGKTMCDHDPGTCYRASRAPACPIYLVHPPNQSAYAARWLPRNLGRVATAWLHGSANDTCVPERPFQSSVRERIVD